MGFSYLSNDGPKECFNAAKSWQLRWYADKTVTLNKKNKKSHVGVLGGIADYSDSNNIVLVKLNTGISKDYYVNFNRKSGINSGTREAGNQVTVVRAKGEGTGYALSELLAKLGEGGKYKIDNFDGKGTYATIEVHSIGATASVSICIGPCPGVSTPSTSPTGCKNSSTWRTTVRNKRRKRRRQKKGCNWVKKKRAQRCGKVGTGKVRARDACPVACNNCPA
jgi:hypothetical protein